MLSFIHVSFNVIFTQYPHIQSISVFAPIHHERKNHVAVLWFLGLHAKIVCILVMTGLVKTTSGHDEPNPVSEKGN